MIIHVVVQFLLLDVHKLCQICENHCWFCLKLAIISWTTHEGHE